MEVLTKVCHGCQRIAREKDASKKADLVEKHSGKMNYKGSSPAMETEGIKRIFARSETTRQLQYTEYFGDGDSKAYSCWSRPKACTNSSSEAKKENKGIGGK